MTWSRKLKNPITLADGRRIRSLADARGIILALPEGHLADAHWQHAAELLLTAARSAKAPLASFEDQLAVALKAEGLIGTKKQDAAETSGQSARRPARLIVRS